MPRLHIAIAVLCGTTGGPATYGRRLVASLASRDQLRLSVLTDRPDLVSSPGVELVELPMRGGLDRLRWQHWAVPRALRRLRPDVYHDTKNALPFGVPCPAVVTVHDLAYHTVPQTFGLFSRTFLCRATKHAVHKAQAIVVPSLATAKDLVHYHPAVRERVHVVPHGIDPAARVSDERLAEVGKRLGLPAHYVLHVGTLQARKNVDLVIQGVRALRQRGLPHRAVVVGRKGWLADAALREIARDETALWIPHLDQDDLAAVYAGADAFVSPSAYEGFGFAVADALAAGVPVIIANVSSLPELCGDAAVALSELSAAAVTTALAEVLQSPERGADLRQKGRARAAGFSWQACAEGHERAYRAAATT